MNRAQYARWGAWASTTCKESNVPGECHLFQTQAGVQLAARDAHRFRGLLAGLARGVDRRDAVDHAEHLSR